MGGANILKRRYPTSPPITIKKQNDNKNQEIRKIIREERKFPKVDSKENLFQKLVWNDKHGRFIKKDKFDNPQEKSSNPEENQVDWLAAAKSTPDSLPLMEYEAPEWLQNIKVNKSTKDTFQDDTSKENLFQKLVWNDDYGRFIKKDKIDNPEEKSSNPEEKQFESNLAIHLRNSAAANVAGNATPAMSPAAAPSDSNVSGNSTATMSPAIVVPSDANLA